LKRSIALSRDQSQILQRLPSARPRYSYQTDKTM